MRPLAPIQVVGSYRPLSPPSFPFPQSSVFCCRGCRLPGLRPGAVSHLIVSPWCVLLRSASARRGPSLSLRWGAIDSVAPGSGA